MDHSDGKAEASSRNGRENARAASTATGLVPWTATAEARRVGADRPRRKRILGVVATVALGVAGLGLGAAAARLAFSHGLSFGIAALPEREAPKESRPESAQALEHRVTEALGALKSEVAELRATVARDQDEAWSAAVIQRLDELTTRFETTKAEATGRMAELAAKIDPFRQETTAKLQALAERLERRSDSGPAAKPPEPAGEARSGPGPVEAARKPPIIRGWVLRGVYDGLALVEGAEGTIEVAPGELLPGAGRVRSIERTSRGWIVVTSRGVIDGARGRF